VSSFAVAVAVVVRTSAKQALGSALAALELSTREVRVAAGATP